MIGQPLAMEGVFSFFLESAFLGLFLFGEKRLSPSGLIGHRRFWCLFGSWISGFFIIVTNAWMQHPVAYRVLPERILRSHQFLGTADESLGTAAVCAQHVRRGDHWALPCVPSGLLCPRKSLLRAWQDFSAGRRDCWIDLLHYSDFSHRRSCMAAIWPSINRRRWRPWKACSSPKQGAGIVLMGQPDEEQQRIDNPLVVNDVLSFLIYGTTRGGSQGARPVSSRPDGPRRSRCCFTRTTSWPDWALISRC